MIEWAQSKHELNDLILEYLIADDSGSVSLQLEQHIKLNWDEFTDEQQCLIYNNSGDSLLEFIEEKSEVQELFKERFDKNLDYSSSETYSIIIEYLCNEHRAGTRRLHEYELMLDGVVVVSDEYYANLLKRGLHYFILKENNERNTTEMLLDTARMTNSQMWKIDILDSTYVFNCALFSQSADTYEFEYTIANLTVYECINSYPNEMPNIYAEYDDVSGEVKLIIDDENVDIGDIKIQRIDGSTDHAKIG